MNAGLRIDVDTFRGTKYGVPNICKTLAENNIKASFFFCVGPDNMGRHLWRLLKPTFLWKMLRTKAASLYGLEILLRGTFWPGPIIGHKLANIIEETAEQGHECGLHSWDHHFWQAHTDNMDQKTVKTQIDRGITLLTEIIKKNPICSAVPGWRCTDLTLQEKAQHPFKYNSDCRGHKIFYPVVNGRRLDQPQVPVTLPTYDEVIGRNGISNENYNDYILSKFSPDKLNVLTIHAEVEGVVCSDMFSEFIKKAKDQNITFLPLGQLVDDCDNIENAEIIRGNIQGREGWVSCVK